MILTPGGYFRYLTSCLLDQELLSMKNFETYKPLDANLEDRKERNEAEFTSGRKHMVGKMGDGTNPYVSLFSVT